MEDLYKRLGVPRSASQRDIRSAYRKRARSHHPDVSSSPDSAAEFARIAEAYRILGDPERRARYDRGEYVSTRPVTFYASHRQQVIAYHRKINRIVDEILESERQETRTRGQVVTVLVTLFISTFVFALVKPIRFDPFEWPVSTIAAVLSLVGLWYLTSVLRKALDHYTYRPAPPSVTHPSEPPAQPFERATAMAFFAACYVGSLVAGVLIDAASGGAFSGGALRNDTVIGALLYPPILVLIIGTMRRIGEVMEAW